MPEQQHFFIADLFPWAYLDPISRAPLPQRIRRLYQFALLAGAAILDVDATVVPA